MQKGIYDEIVTRYLAKKLNDISDKNKQLKKLNEADSNYYLSQYLGKVVEDELANIKADSKSKKSKLEMQIEVCNEIIKTLFPDQNHAEEKLISEQAQKLMSLMDEIIHYKNIHPDTPLSMGALLTGTRQDPSFVSQLKKEITTADEIFILCSFIKWSGTVILLDEFKNFTSEKCKKLKIITTTYMGATDLKAIQALSQLPNTEIKISYDTRRTRLHAKAYMFRRNTGFSSAYVGSSNISNAALTDGLEWNVKISQYEQPYQWEKTIATFDTYWNDIEFEKFTAKDSERLERSLNSEKAEKQITEDFKLPNFDLYPYPFQKEILEKISGERYFKNINKHLIVAATGTGKTMIAAFDFKSFQKQFIKDHNRSPRFLFIAHREEILRQSLYTFRSVLRDQNFGDLMVGGTIPEKINQVFMSIQTFNSKDITEDIEPDFYDYVIIDEFHHAAAKSYTKLLNYLKPVTLLGLTATPERADGLNVISFFNDHITAEIRLPDAIDRKLLCPFQYFGITDSVDYSNIRWQKGGYVVSELTKIYTANDHRAKLVAQKTNDIVLNIKNVKGLGFCVSKKHAEFMAAKFNKYGIPSEYLTSDSDQETRKTVQDRLKNLEINFIFVVDLYNEGVDIPEIDTVLFLRPTESLTVFLQQLGRGLRISENKNCLTVLDFVGQANKNYRYDLRFKALIEDKTRNIAEEVEEGFPHLPAGCNIELERKSKEYILNNIREAIYMRKSILVQKIATFKALTGNEITLNKFLEYYDLELDEIYKRFCWSRGLVEAGLLNNFHDKDEQLITKGLRRIQHIEHVDYIETIIEVLKLRKHEIAGIKERFVTMFILAVMNKTFSSIDNALNDIHFNKNMVNDIINFLEYSKIKSQLIDKKIHLPYMCSLALHSKYTQTEILAGLGYFSFDKMHNVQAGVLYIKELRTDIFFITLNKNEKDYSPTTMYKDYALNEDLFHWQSQSSTAIRSTTGQRYINQKANGTTVLLFVRENKTINGLTQPYYYLGPVDYVSHEGERPINIIWKLRYPMPASILRVTKRLDIG